MTDPPPMPPVNDPPPPSRGSRGLGIGIGIAYVAAVVALNIFTPALPATGGKLLLIPLIVLLVGAIVLASIPRTSGLGTGLLMAFGICLLVGAGVCVALFAVVR